MFLLAAAKKSLEHAITIAKTAKVLNRRSKWFLTLSEVFSPNFILIVKSFGTETAYITPAIAIAEKKKCAFSKTAGGMANTTAAFMAIAMCKTMLFL